MRVAISIGWILLSIGAPLAAASASQDSASNELKGLDERAVVTAVRESIAKRYVVRERRPALDKVLAQGLASGRYDINDPAELAQRIDDDLRRVGRDRHLRFRFDPQQAVTLAAQRNEAAPDPSAFHRQVRRANHGVTELRLLPGNIRYMAYDGFMWIGQESAAALETAMRFLSGGDAIIIDIRRNGGGDADASEYLLSHFLPAGTPLFSYYKEGHAEPYRAFTLATVSAGRVTDKPLYLLISGETGSAAEEFAGNFRGYGLGEVIGENTAGGGYAADLVPLEERFVLTISTGRVVLASTGRDWEGVGIAPTVPAPADEALDRAQVLALNRLVAQAPEDERPRLQALAEGLAARLDPRTPALPLSAYAASFGERTVVAVNNHLYYERGAGARRALIPVGGNRFAFEDDLTYRVEFVTSAKGVEALVIRRPDTSVQGTYKRTFTGP